MKDMTAKLLMAGLAISMAFGPVVRAEENIKAEVGIDVLAVREEGFWAHLSRNWWSNQCIISKRSNSGCSKWLN
jgi:hypothetical protein